ncbi:hypothetical protein CCACVL1_02999 [Corchorus capsularis]|uniref:Uncharacterized protein n=1 Tax=Corchorus capsularis TaxID=210143 RepID=A0A1R3K3X6_COCAP|nr:hypothetical protein CCACVL1_02999 [Corchorus capsularis]
MGYQAIYNYMISRSQFEGHKGEIVADSVSEIAVPDVKETIDQVCNDIGLRRLFTKLPSTAAANIIQMENARNPAELFVTFGQLIELKKKLLNVFIASSVQGTVFGRLSKYMMRELAWTDMAAFKLISDALLVTQSPVLNDLGKITGNNCDKRLAERAKFPMLLAVAQKIMNRPNTSTGGLAPNSTTVNALFQLHQRSVLAAQQWTIDFLTHFTECD